ncbi:hypothetical protein DL96DRAFT_268161 [Flagelloscypha sp. PMI_526]|nr:hypothetical protein DL96DRAFT_268161 [Flagelloscypha sp. PMI_526]
MLQIHHQFKHMRMHYMKKDLGCLFGILNLFVSLSTRLRTVHELTFLTDKAKPVEIGDIGILTKFGAFEVLFNATLPAASQAPMGYRIPPDFQPLSITSSDIQIDPQILTVPFLAHGDIMPTSQGLDSIDTSHKQTQQPFNLSFAAMNGAALIIKDPPTEVALTPERSIEEYIKHNCRAWYHYYEHDPHGPRRNFRGKSLIFVTAVVQNSQWALGAWSSIKTPIRASYSGSATIGDGKFVKIAGQWAPAGRRDVKQGPLDARGTPKPKLRQQDDPENHLAQLTQTLFIRGYVIGVRETRPEILEPSKVYPLPYRSWRDFLKQIFSYGIPAILRAAASPGDLPPPPPPPMSPAVPAEEGSGGEASIVVETHELSPDRQLRHPADDIMDNMFKMDSNLDIIVVHDNTIVELIRSVEGLKKHEPEQLNIRNLEPSSESLDEQDLATKHSKFWSVDSPPADKSTPSQESPIHLPMLRKITDNSALPIPNQTPMFSKIEDDTSRVQADVDIQRLSKSQDLSVERWRNLQPTVPPSKFPDPMLDLKATLKQKSGSSPSLALIPASSRHRRPSSTNSRPQPEVIAPIQPNAPPVPVVPPLRRHQKEWPLPSVLPPGYPEGSRWIRDPTGWPRVEVCLPCVTLYFSSYGLI